MNRWLKSIFKITDRLGEILLRFRWLFLRARNCRDWCVSYRNAGLAQLSWNLTHCVLLQLRVQGVYLLFIGQVSLTGLCIPYLWIWYLIEVDRYGEVELYGLHRLSIAFQNGLMVLFFEKKLLNVAVKNLFAPILDLWKLAFSICLLLKTCWWALGHEITLSIQSFAFFILLSTHQLQSLSFYLLADLMNIDPLCKKLVPMFHDLEFLYHLMADLADSLAYHVTFPRDQNPL